MTPVIEPVISAIVAQKNAYGELLSLARTKRETIVRGDVDSLDEVLAAESRLLSQLGQLDQSRIKAGQILADQTGVSPEELNWNNLPGQTPEQVRDMEQLHQEFVAILGELQQVNAVNSRLLTMHLEYVHELMNAVTQTTETTSYDASGQLSSKRQQAASLFDRVW